MPTLRDVRQQAVNTAREKLKQADRRAESPGHDVASQLERLANLRGRGLLSEDEFRAQKLKLPG